MARNIRSTQLETRTARFKLELRKKPYTVRVAPGVRLGYRRNEVTGTWSVIAADGKGGNWVKKFGLADDHEEADGELVLTFWQAQERARKLARGGKNADREDDVGKPLSVGEALDAYQADLIARHGDVHNVGRVRGHLPNSLNAKTVALLTARELRRFRDCLFAKKLRASSVNRISNALRAALNLAAAQDHRINNQAAWRIGLATIFDAVHARNVILPDQVIRKIVNTAFGIGSELGLLVEVAAVTGARVSQLANLRVADLQDNRPDPRLMMPSSRKGRGRKQITHVPVPIPRSMAETLKRLSKDKAPDSPLLTKPSGERWKQSDHSRLFRRVVLGTALDPSEVTLYALRHSSIVRDLLANVPARIVATKHDTSILMIERNYSKYIADHADALSRRAMLDFSLPSGDNVMSLMQRETMGTP
jgi:integrase